jgi:acyl dehydratase
MHSCAADPPFQASQGAAAMPDRGIGVLVGGAPKGGSLSAHRGSSLAMTVSMVAPIRYGTPTTDRRMRMACEETTRARALAKAGHMLFFEDLAAGQTYNTMGITVTDESVIRFALEYDFQPFHVDKVAAEKSIFGGLIASGIQTIALTMRLCNQAQLFAGNAIAGIGLDEARFLRPLYAGDTIRVVATILECRASKTNPKGGIVRWDLRTFNQKDEEVFKTTLINIMKRRDAA